MLAIVDAEHDAIFLGLWNRRDDFRLVGFDQCAGADKFFYLIRILPSNVLFCLSRYLSRLGTGFNEALHVVRKGRLPPFK